MFQEACGTKAVPSGRVIASAPSVPKTAPRRSNSELHRFYLRGLCRLTGASAGALYLPAASGASASLTHDGDAAPVPELADLQSAAAFARRAGEATTRAVLASGDPEGLLLRLPAAPSSWLLLLGSRRPPTPPAAGFRRRRDGESAAPASPGWLGLRLPAGLAEARRLLEQEQASATWLLEVGSRLVAQGAHLRQALVDPVTGLPGRIGFQALLREELEAARRSGRPLALLLLNPDDFAAVNERHGARQGDRVLAELAGLLLGELRAADGVSRFGGAIFAVVLSATSPERARQVADRLLVAVAKHPFLDGAVRRELRAGIAGASLAPERPLDLVRRADEALRSAKLSAASPVALAGGGDGAASPSAMLATGDLARDYRNMALLRDAVHITTDAGDFHATLQEVLDRLFSALRPDQLVLFERRRDEQPAVLLALRRDSTLGRARVRDVDLGAAGAGIVKAAVATGRVRQVAWGDADGGAGHLAWALPVAHGRRVWGALYVAGGAESLEVGPEDLIFLEAFASQLGIAMDRTHASARQERRRLDQARRLRGQILQLQRAVDRAVLLHRSPAMERLVAQAERLALTDAPVLITGEPGTGKSLLARFVHERSPRRERGLTALDCRSVPAVRGEEELFGSAGGSRSAVGLLAEADLGTLYLAQVSALPDAVQARLMSFVLDPRWPVASNREPRRLDVRLLASAGPDPAADAAAGRLRSDLLGRLGLQRLAVPPLRERPEDIELLAEHFLSSFGRQYGGSGRELSAGARQALGRHGWPGNVRELRNRVLQAVLVATGPILDAEAFGLDSAGEAAAARRRAAPGKAPLLERSRGTLRRELRQQLIAVGRGAGVLPLGRWLGDDLLLEVDSRVGAVARRGAVAAGLPETTYRRRLAKARAQAAAGLAPRTADWHRVREILHRLVRAPDATGRALLDLGEELLLTEILRLHPNDAVRGAGLLGVTVPTFRRRVAAQRRRPPAERG